MKLTERERWLAKAIIRTMALASMFVLLFVFASYGNEFGAIMSLIGTMLIVITLGDSIEETKHITLKFKD